MSSSKRGRSLAEVMSSIDDELHEGVSADTHLPDRSTSSSDPSSDGLELADRALVRSGQQIVPVNVLVAPEDRRRLRQLSLDTNLSLQKLGHEAWNLLLQHRGLPPLKPVSANVPSGRSRP